MKSTKIFYKKRRTGKRGWNQAKLAELSETSAGALSLIERGKRIPHSDVLERISSALGVTADYLLLSTKESKDFKDYLKALRSRPF